MLVFRCCCLIIDRVASYWEWVEVISRKFKLTYSAGEQDSVYIPNPKETDCEDNAAETEPRDAAIEIARDKRDDADTWLKYIMWRSNPKEANSQDLLGVKIL